MTLSKRFIIIGLVSYLLLILYEQIHVTNLNIHIPPTNYEHVNGMAKTKQQLPIMDNCLPLPPPEANTPRIFVHIGPHKTGTTSLQDYLACNTEFLKKHNTYYLGKVNMYDVKRCTLVPPDFLRPLIQNPTLQGLDKLRHMIQHFTSGGNNVIMSSEDIFDIPRNHTDQLFAKTVHAYPVVGYRRYHDWLLSSYRFNYGEPKWYDMEMWRDWDGHDNIPTFPEFVRQYSNRIHPTLESMQKFNEMQQSNVKPCPQILNFHLGDVTKQFVKLITTRDSVPASVYTNINDESKLYAVDAERLALILYRVGKIHAVLSRRVVVDVIQHKLSLLYKTSTPPLDCLSLQEQEVLLEKTKATEKQMLPDFYSSPDGEATLEEDFQALSERKVFCNIDLDEMLKEQEWVRVLVKLKAGRLRQDDFN